jgi:hypothetical protein
MQHAKSKLFIEVEYDLTYSGGDYDKTGQFALVPLLLVEELGLEKAFEQHTKHSAVHIIHYSPDEPRDENGDQADVSQYTDSVLQSVTDAMGYLPEEWVIDRAVKEYGTNALSELEEALADQFEKLEDQGGRGIELAEDIDALRIAIAYRKAGGNIVPKLTDFTVTVAGEERHDGESPYTYVIKAADCNEAAQKVIIHFKKSEEKRDVVLVEVIQGVPGENCPYAWNDLR